MNQQTHASVSTLLALLRVTLAQAERHGLDEIRISTGRARTLLHEFTIIGKQTEAPKAPAFHARLDAIHA
jgi:hypothetical protein